MKPVKKQGKHVHRHYMSDSTPAIAAIGAGALVILVALSFLLSSNLLHSRDTGIILPGSAEDTPNISTGSSVLTGQSVADIEITTGNAQTVIASLTRPTAYQCRIENTLYYEGGSASLLCRRYARSGLLCTETVNSEDQVQSTLLSTPDGRLYAWNAGEGTAYEGRTGAFSDDAAAMLPTYEDVLDEDVELTDAGKQTLDGEPCITVTFDREGYRCVYAVSTVSGLLKQAAFYSGDTLTRKVTVSEIRIEIPDGAKFLLPDGSSVSNQ